MNTSGLQELLDLDINLLQPNPLQVRNLIKSESLVDLVESIKEHGILEPLVVAKTPAGFQIIAGERRWRAAKIIGLKTIPVVVKETTAQGMLEMALVENVQREDLNPIERAQGLQRLIDEFSLTVSEIAKRIGKSPAYVSNTLRLLTLPDAIKDALLSGATTEGHARALASLEDPHLIVEAYKEILSKNLSVRGAEELARKLRSRENIAPRQQKPTLRLQSEELDKYQEELTSKLTSGSVKVKVKIGQSRIEAKLQIIARGKVEDTSKLIKSLRDTIVAAGN